MVGELSSLTMKLFLKETLHIQNIYYPYYCLQVVESVHSEIMKAVRSIQFKTDVFLSQDVLQALIRFSEAASKINLDGNGRMCVVY